MHILVLSARLTENRRAAFRALTRELGEPRFAASGGPPPDVSECDAIVVDGPQPAQPRQLLAALRATVERGAALVAIGAAPVERDGFWADLLGAVAETPRGAGRVVACGLGNTDQALRNPELAQLLGRALRPDLHCCGRNIGVGIVGYGPLGGMGYHHGLGVTGTDGVELVAVVDPSVERRKAAETDFPGVRTYASVTDLLSDDDVEVAFVATPPAHHAALSLDLLRAGKHVACEKPLCLTVAEADQLMATAAAHGRVLTVYQNRRWDPDFVDV